RDATVTGVQTCALPISRKNCSPGENREDGCAALGRPRRDDHPVAHGGQIVAILGAIVDSSGDLREEFALFREYPVEPFALPGHEIGRASGRESVAAVGG